MCSGLLRLLERGGLEEELLKSCWKVGLLGCLVPAAVAGRRADDYSVQISWPNDDVLHADEQVQGDLHFIAQQSVPLSLHSKKGLVLKDWANQRIHL